MLQTNPNPSTGHRAIFSSRPYCRRCGRQVEAHRLASLGAHVRCSTCSLADQARHGGFSSNDYSPFRPLLSASKPEL